MGFDASRLQKVQDVPDESVGVVDLAHGVLHVCWVMRS